MPKLNIKQPPSPDAVRGILGVIGKLAFFLLIAALRRDNR